MGKHISNEDAGLPRRPSGLAPLLFFVLKFRKQQCTRRLNGKSPVKSLLITWYGLSHCPAIGLWCLLGNLWIWTGSDIKMTWIGSIDKIFLGPVVGATSTEDETGNCFDEVNAASSERKVTGEERSGPQAQVAASQHVHVLYIISHILLRGATGPTTATRTSCFGDGTQATSASSAQRP